ncbi:hypothetical protein F5Y14DRAFT_181761 [Nemania sp. NC0429]|nr:hypothetical protein F5Y14DRAFT_181761 [Nemania sp. NC0429]
MQVLYLCISYLTAYTNAKKLSCVDLAEDYVCRSSMCIVILQNHLLFVTPISFQYLLLIKPCNIYAPVLDCLFISPEEYTVIHS